MFCDGEAVCEQIEDVWCRGPGAARLLFSFSVSTHHLHLVLNLFNLFNLCI